MIFKMNTNQIKKALRFPSFFLFLFSSIFINCSTTLLNRSDYSSSLKQFSQNKPSEALNNFPVGEKSSFITTMEKTYLSLLSGKPEIAELSKFAKMVEERVRFSVSRELKTFFYLETPDGYYASEHEIVWMHLLLSWGYSLKGDYDSAKVEAKIASNLLSGEFSAEGRFDDPLIRILLGFVWSMAGNWDDAKVDFRQAYNLRNDLKWCLTLSEYESMPEDMILILGGVGFEPYWDPKTEFNPVRGIRGLAFSGLGKKSNLYGEYESGEVLELLISPDSKEWYNRHFIRDNEIHDLVRDSIYGQKFLGSGIKAGVVVSGAVVAGIGVSALGIGIGGAMIYLGVECSCGDLTNSLIAGGFAVAYYGVKLGIEITQASYDYSKADIKDTLDTSDDYRFVRFLPEYVWVGVKPSPLESKDSYTSSYKIRIGVNRIGKNKNISIGQYSDIK
jgi:hypothetical protein